MRMSDHYTPFPPKYQQVLTLMGHPEVAPLTQAEVDSMVDMIAHQGGIVEDIDWLAPDAACDIFFAVLGVEEVREMAAQLLANVPFDAVVQRTEHRKKKLIISDMDSTMIEQECIDELADFAGIKPKIAAITEQAMRGELDFKEALRARVTMLKGLEERVLQQCYDTHITLMPGAKTLVQTMKAHGAHAVLVSGGFTFFTERVAAAIGFDTQEANILNIEQGTLTGTVAEPILDKEAKLCALTHYRQEHGLLASQVLAVGDGANDLPMLLGAGLGVAFRAKPLVQAQAHAAIGTCDLTALLYAQGYRITECVEG